MADKKAAIINISQAIAGVSLITLAAVGSASGNIAIAGLTAVPAAVMTVGPTLAKLKEKKEALLELDVPPWWTSEPATWKGLCAEIADHLPHILQEMVTQLQKEQRVITTQVVYRTFIDAVANEHLTWEYDSQHRREVAIEIAPPVLQKVSEVLKVAIDPIRQDMTLIDIHNTAMNTAQMVEQLEKAINILEHIRKQGSQSAPNNTSVIMDTNSSITQVTPADTRSPSPDADIQQKIKNDAYDVYVCYNIADEAEAMTLGKQLKVFGVLPWLDSWRKPGRLLLEQQREQIARIKSAAVLVGKNGIATIQQTQADAFLQQFVLRSDVSLIPVFLKDAPDEPLPIFLDGFGWVDFRKQEPDPMKWLLWGITGERPEV